ncbi:hypothetical protein CXZ05_06615 [Arthrobacter sp. AFG20]|nr:hypothetical protein CXZ05_06615 [Arthrobacter sp. AFG20]
MIVLASWKYESQVSRKERLSLTSKKWDAAIGLVWLQLGDLQLAINRARYTEAGTGWPHQCFRFLAKDGTRMIVDFILELTVVAHTFMEQLFDRRSPAGKGRVRKSLERLKTRRSENPLSFFGANCLHPDLIGWQIVWILDVAQMGQQNQLRVVGGYGQMSQQ